MKAKFLMLVLVISAGLMTLTSCTSSKGTGCKSTAGYVGYGNRLKQL